MKFVGKRFDYMIQIYSQRKIIMLTIKEISSARRTMYASNISL